LYNSSCGISKIPSKSSWLIPGWMVDSILVPYDLVKMIEPEIIDLVDDEEDNKNEMIDDVIEVWI